MANSYWGPLGSQEALSLWLSPSCLSACVTLTRHNQRPLAQFWQKTAPPATLSSLAPVQRAVRSSLNLLVPTLDYWPCLGQGPAPGPATCGVRLSRQGLQESQCCDLWPWARALSRIRQHVLQMTGRLEVTQPVRRGARTSSRFCLMLKLILLTLCSLCWALWSPGGFCGGVSEGWAASQAPELKDPL